jgi:catechol 2,3-dioxygenase-like lactoylglutathione lyase family enzyme
MMLNKDEQSRADLQYAAARDFWERVFLLRAVEYHKNQVRDDSASAWAAKDADGALKEWRERWLV